MINSFREFISRRRAVGKFRGILYDEISMMVDDAHLSLMKSDFEEGLEKLHDAALLYGCLPSNLYLEKRFMHFLTSYHFKKHTKD